MAKVAVASSIAIIISNPSRTNIASPKAAMAAIGTVVANGRSSSGGERAGEAGLPLITISILAT